MRDRPRPRNQTARVSRRPAADAVQLGGDLALASKAKEER